MKRNVEGEMIKGHTEMLVLAMLAGGEPRHGYRIRQEMIELSDHKLHPAHSRLYPLLKQMVKKGWLISWQETVCERRVRTAYQITKAGSAELTAQKKRWELFSRAVTHLLKRA
jgi:DNA-binding PadR family transcriptional regulator